MDKARLVEAWEHCMKRMKVHVPQQYFETWFVPVKPLSYKNKTLTLEIPSHFFSEMIDQYASVLRDAMNVEIGEGTQLFYQISIGEESQTFKSNGKKSIENEAVGGETAERTLPKINSNLNYNYTFENFVQGTENKLARVAGMSISDDPSRTIFNPLFVFGDSGVGKTHLVNAIGIRTKEKHPEKRVLYVSAHLFVQQYMQATADNHRNDFLNFYQQIDVLIIDDIHDFAAKTGTQGALFHIFNYLHQAGKQLIFTSDRAPQQLEGFEERLLSRFKWGLQARIEKPGYDLRKAIFENKVAGNGLKMSHEVVNYIARHVEENRSMEGVIASLLAHSIANDNQDFDLALAKEVVDRSTERRMDKSVSIDAIKKVVCAHYAITMSDLEGKNRSRNIATARQMAMFLAKKYTTMSYSAIGLEVGHRNHATVLHACRVVSEQLEVAPETRKELEQIEDQL